MTPDQIIEQLWKMPLHEVYKVAFYDDFILLCKSWPFFLISFGLAIAFVGRPNK